MNEDDKTPPEEERTVFVGGSTPPEDAAEPDSPRLEPVAPQEGSPEPAALPETPAVEPNAEHGAPGSSPEASEPPATVSAPSTTQAFTPHKDAVGIREGDVLNHIFEVKRFIARGGMGEVFEGCNVNTDEKVAIKVMLPALANDEKVIAMFRKEARTLTKLHHPALVQYRVLAQEPSLHVLYIVTDYIDGTNLSTVLDAKRSPDELAGLLRRLASGLGAAHQLGAVHRDMSPDNVILADDDIHRAKIIDFGIAKDLDASSATIVGDGFAGKLNYVAPEQLGDFGREIGPWTDVYSLGLVILAVANGKNVDMSGSLVDAIDKRRRGPDLSAVPGNLRPLLEAMLRPDPQERLRSMDEVLARLDGTAPPVAPPPPPPPSSGPARVEPDLSTPDPTAGSSATKWVLIVVAIVVLLALAAFGYSYWRNNKGADPAPAPPPGGTVPADVIATGDPVARARGAINSVLPSVSCTWLDVADIQGDGNAMTVALRGVAGDRNAAVEQIRSALVQADIQNPTLVVQDVATINQSGCAALDTFRQVRASDGGRLTTEQPRFEMVLQDAGEYAGREAATARLTLDVSDTSRDFALLAIDPAGDITMLIPDRATFERLLADSRGGRPISQTGPGRYVVHLDADHTGWSGVILVSGQAPFDPALVQPAIGARDAGWSERFRTIAAERGWRTEMVWYESVNRDVQAGGGAGKPTG